MKLRNLFRHWIKIKPEDTACTCGHTLKAHEFFLDVGQSDCLKCVTDPKFVDNKVKYCRAFKLDNLKYIEDLARAKDLV